MRTIPKYKYSAHERTRSARRQHTFASCGWITPGTAAAAVWSDRARAQFHDIQIERRRARQQQLSSFGRIERAISSPGRDWMATNGIFGEAFRAVEEIVRIEYVLFLVADKNNQISTLDRTQFKYKKRFESIRITYGASQSRIEWLDLDVRPVDRGTN